MTTDFVTMTKEFWTSDFCEWPDTISIYISSELKIQIDKAFLILSQNPKFESIDVTADEVFNDEVEDGMQRSCPYDVSKIIVYRPDKFCLYVQARRDARIQAEYMPS